MMFRRTMTSSGQTWSSHHRSGCVPWRLVSLCACAARDSSGCPSRQDDLQSFYEDADAAALMMPFGSACRMLERNSIVLQAHERPGTHPPAAQEQTSRGPACRQCSTSILAGTEESTSWIPLSKTRCKWSGFRTSAFRTSGRCMHSCCSSGAYCGLQTSRAFQPSSATSQ